MANDFEKQAISPYYETSPLDKDFLNNIKTHIIRNLDELKMVCDVENRTVAFDTETTGITYFSDKIVGCSISFNGISGVYVPLRHENADGTLADYNLPLKESLDLIYNKLLKRNTILLYNSCFDLTMIGQELWQIGLPFNNIETIKFLDVLCLVHFLEPEIKSNGLKWAARHFLGRLAPEFSQITGISKRSKTDMHFGKIDPHIKKTIIMEPITLTGAKKKFTEADILHNRDCLEIPQYEASGGIYACCDSLNTYALWEKLMPVAEKMYLKHAKGPDKNNQFALAVDNRLAKAMLYYKHIDISFDADYMKDMLDKTEKRIEEVQSEIYEIAGEVFNINSVAQKRAVFVKLGIDTGVTTKTGMSVSVDAIKGVDHPIVSLLSEYSALQKRKSAYFEPLSQRHIGRINYRTTSLSTGRLSSSGDNNDYYSSISIQTLPKSKNCVYEAIRTAENSPEVILGYKFIKRDAKYQEEHPNAVYVEGFLQDDAIRPCLCSPHHIYVDKPDGEVLDFGFNTLNAEEFCRRNNISLDCIRIERNEDWVIMSTDFSAEELCLIADLSDEPSFVNPLLAGADLHKTMSEKMFGHKYDFSNLDRGTRKNLRKKAKAGNFGLAYRGSYKALLREIPDENEAMEVYQSWWDNMPIYKAWQSEKINEMMTLTDGDAINIYGRRRRFRPLLATGNQSIINSAIRAACNHFIQGTAAVLMRIIMCELYEKYLKQGQNYDEIRFVASIHDEIALAVRRDVIEKWAYRVVDLMESVVPKSFRVPLKGVPGIGTNMGSLFDFEFDRDENGKIIEGTLHLKV